MYGEWSSGRDRINHWLLHCIHSDETQQIPHGSMLAECLADSRDWAAQVLDSWHLDDATTGEDFQLSGSADAINSRDGSISDGSINIDRTLRNDLEASCLADDVNRYGFSTLSDEELSHVLDLDEVSLPLKIHLWIRGDMRQGADRSLYNPY